MGGIDLKHFGEDPEANVKAVLQEYKIHNAEILFREDATPDELIDVLIGTRRYVRCLYAYNKVDMLTVEEVDELARRPNSIVISCGYVLIVHRLYVYTICLSVPPSTHQISASPLLHHPTYPFYTACNST